MRLIAYVLALGLFAPLFAAPAYAQATRTWVSGVGDDVNPCSRTAPCKTFAGAISKTAASGEINCLDSAGFGSLTITKSITVYCEGVVGGIVSPLTNGININAAVTDVVTLRGLDFEGAATGLVGINIINAGSVHIQNSTIRNYRGGNASGIRLASTGNTDLEITNVTITDSGSGATGGGIVLIPSGSSVVRAVVDRATLARNSNGIVVNGATTSGGISTTVRDTTVFGGVGTQTGLNVTSAGSFITAMVERTMLSNFTTGLSASGSNATVRLGTSSITGNGTATSGNVVSYNTNQITGNAVDTVPTLIPLH